jgi:hypothetical protein
VGSAVSNLDRDRLAEIKANPIDPAEPCMRSFAGTCQSERDWLIAEVEFLREQNARDFAELRRLNGRWRNRNPTQDAYDGVCAALHKHSDRAYATAEALGLDRYASREELVAEVQRLRAAASDVSTDVP